MSENGDYTEVSNSDESEGVQSLDWDGLTKGSHFTFNTEDSY